MQVRTLVEEAASLLRASLPAGVKLVIEDVPVVVAVSGEPAQLQQIVVNLCSNAAHAMEGGVCINLRAEQRDRNGARNRS